MPPYNNRAPSLPSQQWAILDPCLQNLWKNQKMSDLEGFRIKLRLRETKQLAQDLEETDEEGTRIQSIILHHSTQAAIFFLRLNNLTSCGFPTSLPLQPFKGLDFQLSLSLPKPRNPRFCPAFPSTVQWALWVCAWYITVFRKSWRQCLAGRSRVVVHSGMGLGVGVKGPLSQADPRSWAQL